MIRKNTCHKSPMSEDNSLLDFINLSSRTEIINFSVVQFVLVCYCSPLILILVSLHIRLIHILKNTKGTVLSAVYLLQPLYKYNCQFTC